MNAHWSLLVSLTVLLVACGESTPPPVAVPPPNAPSSSSPSASTAPSTGALQKEEWQAPEAATKEVVRKECGPLLEALAGTAKGNAADIEKAVRSKLDELSQNPPLPAAPFAWCKAQFLLELDRLKDREASSDASEVRAKTNLALIGKNMMAAYEREDLRGARKLCPSAKPAPTKIDTAGATYTSTAADWKDPGWTCLGFQLEGPQDFQYEVKVEGGSFSAIARRAGADPLELSLTGKIDSTAKRLVIAPTIDAKRKPSGPRPKP